MARFRLMVKDASGNKTNKHCMGPLDPKTRRWARVVQPGEIIESDKPLDELFRGKFERLPDAPAAESDAEPKARRKVRS